MRKPATGGKDEVRIAMATIRMVAEQGAERVTTADVVKELGVTRVDFLQRCPSEADLWRITATVIVRQMAHAWNVICALEHKPAERLRALLAAQVRLVTTTPALRDILFSRRLQQSQVSLRREIAGARKQFHALLAQTIREGVGAGEFSEGIKPERAAQAIMEMLQGMVLSWSLAFVADINLEEVWTRVEPLLGLRAEGSPDCLASTEAN